MKNTFPMVPADRSGAHETALARRFVAVRAQTEALARPLSAEDCQVQSMPDASPVKWHLAHTTWFFETFVLEPFEPGFMPFDAAFRVLFNSYYQGVGSQHPRPQRGLVTRPGLDTVLQWRARVNDRMLALLRATGDVLPPALAAVVELGLQNEQQHQELILSDLKHLLSCNPVLPAYAARWPLATVAPVAAEWLDCAGGLVQVGHAEPMGFCFDNERPRHTQHLRPYRLANRLVTHGEWARFVRDGGYQDARWWLACGWDWVRAQGIQAPLYWHRSQTQGPWQNFTLHGPVPLDPHTPVVHISYFEADAFARWASACLPGHAGARLPTEFEWEAAVAPDEAVHVAAGNFLDSGALHPMPVAQVRPGLMQAMGDVWQWTSSSYAPYPGFVPWPGLVGEYNGKFMVNQYVLRGGSCATPMAHIRATYRNFFPTDARWQFTGLRLAADA